MCVSLCKNLINLHNLLTDDGEEPAELSLPPDASISLTTAVGVQPVVVCDRVNAHKPEAFDDSADDLPLSNTLTKKILDKSEKLSNKSSNSRPKLCGIHKEDYHKFVKSTKVKWFCARCKDTRIWVKTVKASSKYSYLLNGQGSALYCAVHSNSLISVHDSHPLLSYCVTCSEVGDKKMVTSTFFCAVHGPWTALEDGLCKVCEKLCHKFNDGAEKCEKRLKSNSYLETQSDIEESNALPQPDAVEKGNETYSLPEKSLVPAQDSVGNTDIANNLLAQGGRIENLRALQRHSPCNLPRDSFDITAPCSLQRSGDNPMPVDASPLPSPQIPTVEIKLPGDVTTGDLELCRNLFQWNDDSTTKQADPIPVTSASPTNTTSCTYIQDADAITVEPTESAVGFSNDMDSNDDSDFQGSLSSHRHDGFRGRQRKRALSNSGESDSEDRFG